MDESYIAAYGERGALLDLATVDDLLPTAQMDDTVLDTGKVRGKLVGLPIGVTNLSMTVNPMLFEKAGIAIPDDKTWTWDDYERIAAELSAKLGPDAYGSGGIGISPIELTFWTRQRGEQIFPTDGQKPVSKETVKAYFEYALSMISSGAAPANTVQVENASSPLDASLLATNRSAMAVIWNTQVSAYGPAAGTKLGLLRLPATEPGKHEMANKASMYWSISARSTKQQQAAKLVDFLLTDPAATTILTSERGVPAIDSVRTDIASLVDDQARVALEFASEVAPELTTPSQVTPGSASSWANDFTLVGTEVLFGRITPDEGATRVLDLLKGYE